MIDELVQEALDHVAIGGKLGDTFRFRQKDVRAVKSAMMRNNPGFQYDRKRVLLKGSGDNVTANRSALLGADDCDSCHPDNLQGQELPLVDGYVDLEVVMSKKKDGDVGRAIVRYDTRNGEAEVIRSTRY